MLDKQLAELEWRVKESDNCHDVSLMADLHDFAPQFIAVAKAAQEVIDAFADLPLTGFDTDERYGAEGRVESALEQQVLALAALSAALPSVKRPGK